jgi:hypothetical protein
MSPARRRSSAGSLPSDCHSALASPSTDLSMTGGSFTPMMKMGHSSPSTEPRTQRAVPWVSPQPRVPRSASRLHSAQHTAEPRRQRTALFIRGSVLAMTPRTSAAKSASAFSEQPRKKRAVKARCNRSLTVAAPFRVFWASAPRDPRCLNGDSPASGRDAVDNRLRRFGARKIEHPLDAKAVCERAKAGVPECILQRHGDLATLTKREEELLDFLEAFAFDKH